MHRELREVLKLVPDLPEIYQKKAAKLLRKVVEEHEEGLMEPELQRRLQEIRRRALCDDMERLIDRHR